MKRGPFHFRFERLARVRSIQERVARAEWTAAEAAAHAAHEGANSLREQIAAARARTSADQLAGRIGPRDVLAGDRVMDSLFRALTRYRQQELSLRGAADEKRRAWNSRERECQSLARLRERRLKEHRSETERTAAAELDELTAARSGHQASRLRLAPTDDSEQLPAGFGRSPS